MKELIERSYQAIRNRGLINDNTHELEFLLKAKEELSECTECFAHHEKYIEELTDLATVCIMQIRHLGYDFEKEFEKVIIKYEKRAK